ncbi:MAG: acetyl-CoA carboxylase biotin carboxylase subunit [Spirochaetes bacterium]|nr:acetyl-CoA carboxylase biotin carboxylase subunit [Spirochaetota bacterium]
MAKITKVLIANRGEIALRVVRACKELGIPTVAVHSQADEESLHSRFADQDVCIGPAPSRESYLNIPRIISACEITGADAIHPGYGFLSENASFSDICREHNIKFIGPSREVINKMGDKANARETMKKAGVPVTPGTGILKDAEEAISMAKEIGFPVILKATAGGGGKGMRICRSDAEIRQYLPIAQHEAKIGFNNPDVYMEKYIENPRHIEIQILADEHGNVIYLGERDCSLQRRHQKLLEESPSPVMTPELRKKMGEAAVRGAQLAGYQGAGTIEFLVDDKGSFYFMEMNTRVQVEHPVTELVTGVDIVREQILIAMGEKLRYTQDDIKVSGHAIECRINAEDWEYDFRPSPGTIKRVHFPGGFGVRIDSHVYSDYSIPPHYDSLIAKFLVHGANRMEAISRMKRVLEEAIISGVPTTIPFHQKIMEHPVFLQGKVTTKFLEEHNLKEKAPEKKPAKGKGA